MGKPHKHAEIIKAWADGAEIQCEISQGNWCDIGKPDWHEEVKFRIKPEPPKYPQTKMHDQEIREMLKSPCAHVENFRMMMNAAIARAIEDGQVVFIPNYVDALKFSSEPMVPAAMLEKVADEFASVMAMQAAERTPGPSGYPLMQAEIESIAASARIRIRRELGAIIAKVKKGK